MSRLHLSRRRILTGITAGVTGLGAVGTVAGDTTDANCRDDRFIIGVSSDRGANAARRSARSVRNDISLGPNGRAVAGRFPEEARQNLSKRPDVRFIEKDIRVQLLEETLPWGVDRIDADVTHSQGDTGANSHVAVIDTGIDADHPDLGANLGIGWNFVAGSSDWDDDNGHGTHVAGTVGAVDNSQGVRGVVTETTLHAAKALTSDGGYVSDIAAALEWVSDKAASDWGHAVANMSLGSASSSRTLRDACAYAYDRNVVLVAAAGNSGDTTVQYPARYDTVIAVSAVDQSDVLASFSNTGDAIELTAPGVEITSTVPSGYTRASGTSMAAPHVSGAAAVLLANGDSNTEARNRLAATAEDIGLPSSEQGAGLVDVEAAVESLSDGTDDGSDGGDDGGSSSGTAPSIDSLRVVDTSGKNPHAELLVEWSVSDADGDLASVETVVADSRDRVQSRVSTNVSGGSASGSDEHRIKFGDGETYEVTVLVTDETELEDIATATVRT